MYHAICSDRGTVKKINQDSALYKQASTGNGDLMLACQWRDDKGSCGVV